VVIYPREGGVSRIGKEFYPIINDVQSCTDISNKKLKYIYIVNRYINWSYYSLLLLTFIKYIVQFNLFCFMVLFIVCISISKLWFRLLWEELRDLSIYFIYIFVHLRIHAYSVLEIYIPSEQPPAVSVVTTNPLPRNSCSN